jgi:hypothetical protein
MPRPIVNGDIIMSRLNFQHDGASTVGYNILHYQVGSSAGAPPSTGVALSAMATAIANKFSPLWKPWAGPDSEMVGATCQATFPLPRSVSQTHTFGAPVVGEGVDDSLPLQDAPTLLKTTDYGQRWGIGRLFYFGLAEDYQDNGRVMAGAVAGLGAMAAALADGLVVTSGGWACTLTPVLLSGPSDNPTRITPITGGRLATTIIRSQRRRRPGKGI